MLDVPQFHELSTKKVWANFKDDPAVNIYFPDYSASRLPQKGYLFNVVNTVRKNSIIDAVRKIKEKRMCVTGTGDAAIALTSEYMGFMDGFNTIVVEDR